MDALTSAIEARTEEIVALTQALVRIPTINPPGDAYTACAELLGQRLRRRGFTVQYIRAEGSPGDSPRYPRTNVLARLEGRRPGPCVHFNGHIDVVPVGEGWTVDPFGGGVHDGKVYGRGTCDMKGGLAAAVIAVEALVDSMPDWCGAIEISGTVDEESGGYGGVGYLARQGLLARPRVDHVIIPEPLNVDRVCIGHRGVWWAEIETLGRTAHGSMPFLGDCAIRHMGAVLTRFERDLFPRLAERSTRMPVVPQGAQRSTLNIDAVHGGLPDGLDGLPSAMVPDRCRMLIERRYLIEENLDQVRTEITDILDSLKAERSRFDYRLREVMEFPPTLTDPDLPVVRAVAAAVHDVLGRPAELVVSPGTYDQKHVVRFGHLNDCIAYGPGILDLAHQPDEYVAINDLVTAAKVMAMAAHALLSGAIARPLAAPGP